MVLENIVETGINPEAVPKKASQIKDTDSKVEEVAEEKPEAPAADSDGDDLMSKLNELDDPENAPKKKEEKSDEEEDAGGMDDLLGKLDELQMVRVPGFEPGLQAWQARVIPGYTTPACHRPQKTG